MRRTILLAAVMSVCALGFAQAAAAEWQLRFNPVKRDSARKTGKACQRERGCVGWASKCERLHAKRIHCLQALWYEEPGIVGEELRCDVIAKYGFGAGNRLKLTFSKPDCYYVLA
jgi:hypothetical protein